MIKIISILGNKNAGFILGLAAVFNLALGSLIMNLHPELYPRFFPFDLNFFFTPMLGVHFWLYLLLFVFLCFGINTIACFIEALILLRRTGIKRQKMATLLIHLSIILALLAHLYEGFYGHSTQIVISNQKTQIQGIGSAKVERVQRTTHPDGSLKDTEVTIDFDLPDVKNVRKEISYNVPALFDAGRREVIIQEGGTRPVGFTLLRERDKKAFRLTPNTQLSFPEGRLQLLDIIPTRIGIPFARLRFQRQIGEDEMLLLALTSQKTHHSQIKVGHDLLLFQSMVEAPYVSALIRYNPAIPIVIVSVLCMTIGLLLYIRMS